MEEEAEKKVYYTADLISMPIIIHKNENGIFFVRNEETIDEVTLSDILLGKQKLVTTLNL